MHFRAILLASTIALTGCASITAVPLNPDGSEKLAADSSHAVQGIRYYMPKPYLLVTELPEAAKDTASTGDNTGNTGNNKGAGAPKKTKKGGNQAAGNKNGSKKDDTADKTGDTPTASTPSSSAADTSFSASSGTYSIKLIYLPDYSKPMALQANSGILGTTNFTPTLLDGWMLTNMTGSVDSGGSNVVSAISSLVKGGSPAKKTGDSQGGAGGPQAQALASGSADAVKKLQDDIKNSSATDDEQSTLAVDLNKLKASASPYSDAQTMFRT